MYLSHNRLATIAAAGLLAIFLVDAFVPTAIAKPDGRTERPGTPERSHERGGAAPEAAEHTRRAPEKRLDSSPSFSLRLEGTAVDRHNVTYRIVLEGDGRARTHERNGTERALYGFARLEATLYDANGTVVRNGTLEARLHARLNETGVWHWHLVALGPHKRDADPFGAGLVLRGTASSIEGGLQLEGEGRAATKLPDAKPGRTRLRLDVEGELRRGA